MIELLGPLETPVTLGGAALAVYAIAVAEEQIWNGLTQRGGRRP